MKVLTRTKAVLAGAAVLGMALAAGCAGEQSGAPDTPPPAAAHPDPAQPPDDLHPRLREIFFTPGGRYTEADIEANGPQPPNRKFEGLPFDHDKAPEPGEQICPVTDAKVNPSFSWTINGEEYLFCCPPCIEDFVRRAKEDPDSIHPPEHYVRR